PPHLYTLSLHDALPISALFFCPFIAKRCWCVSYVERPGRACWGAEACTEPAESKRFFCPTGTVRTVSPARQRFRGQFAEGLLVGGGEMTGLGKAQAVRQIHQLQVTRAN